MNLKNFFVFFGVILLPPFLKSQTKNVLFLGNSYTYSNNLPVIIHRFANANGQTFTFDQNTPGGYTLQGHATNSLSLSKIAQGGWDYVVLQDQSQRPSLDCTYVMQNVIPYAVYLDSLIGAANSCTQTLFFQTWGRKYGDGMNCPSYPPVCTFSGMQNRLTTNYKWMADTAKGIVSPVGEAFRLSMQTDSNINLYTGDYSHPSLESSYLAACVFYEIIFKTSVAGNSFLSGLPSNVAIFLQNIAGQVVRGTPNSWNLGIHEPWAWFDWQEVNQSGLCIFSQHSSAAFSHFWNFGDNNTSTVPNPVHQYNWSQYFPVYHLVSNACSSDSFYLVNNIIGPMGLTEGKEIKVQVFPNPSRGSFQLDFSDSDAEIKIIGLKGEVLWTSRIRPLQKISWNTPGCYRLEVQTKSGHFQLPLLIIPE